MVVWFLHLGEISIVFSIMAVPIYSSTSSVQESPFLTSLPAYIVFFIETILIVWHDVWLWFWFVYLWLMMLSIYSCTICLSSLEKCLFWSFTHIVIKLFCFFFCSWVVCVWILLPYQINGLQMFSPSPYIVYAFYWLFPLLDRALYFNVVLFWPKRSLFRLFMLFISFTNNRCFLFGAIVFSV